MATVDPAKPQPHRTSNETIWQQLEKASQLVQSWPPWKQNLLELTSRSTNSSPRAVIVDVKTTDDAVANEL